MSPWYSHTVPHTKSCIRNNHTHTHTHADPGLALHFVQVFVAAAFIRVCSQSDNRHHPHNKYISTTTYPICVYIVWKHTVCFNKRFSLRFRFSFYVSICGQHKANCCTNIKKIHVVLGTKKSFLVVAKSKITWNLEDSSIYFKKVKKIQILQCTFSAPV